MKAFSLQFHKDICYISSEISSMTILFDLIWPIAMCKTKIVGINLVFQLIKWLVLCKRLRWGRYHNLEDLVFILIWLLQGLKMHDVLIINLSHLFLLIEATPMAMCKCNIIWSTHFRWLTHYRDENYTSFCEIAKKMNQPWLNHRAYTTFPLHYRS